MQVFSVPDIPSLYAVPVLLERQGLVRELERRLKLTRPLTNPHQQLMPRWAKLIERCGARWVEPTWPCRCGRTQRRWREGGCRQDGLRTEVSIAVVGKYVELHDSYTSVIKSLEHAAMAAHRRLRILVRGRPCAALRPQAPRPPVYSPPPSLAHPTHPSGLTRQTWRSRPRPRRRPSTTTRGRRSVAPMACWCRAALARAASRARSSPPTGHAPTSGHTWVCRLMGAGARRWVGGSHRP
jgi:hypothetical protein